MKVSCLMPTYNRFPNEAHLVNEAVNSFLNQDYANKELIICNDTPGQIISFNHPQVKVINVPERFESLSHKLRYMIHHADGFCFCRWDDDDISLPWRLSMSIRNLGDKDEWRCENHFYSENNRIMKITEYPGNSHNMSIWTRRINAKFDYPMHQRVMGDEDQAFNKMLISHGYPPNGTLLSPLMIFYIYRWGVSQRHLSSSPLTWKNIGTDHIQSGSYAIKPGWQKNYLSDSVKYLKMAGLLNEHHREERH